MVSGKIVKAAVWPFWMFGSFLGAFCQVSLHYISPSTNPLHIVPIGQGNIPTANRSPQTPRGTPRVRKRPMCCVFVCYCCCCCCCCSCARGFVVWLILLCKVWFSPCSGSESLPLRLQQSEFRGGQSPHHLSPIFHQHPRHLGGVFYKKLKNVSCEYHRV